MLPTCLITRLVLIAALCEGGPAYDLSSLRVALDLTPHQVQLGDLVYAKVVLKNAGNERIHLPASFCREEGTLRFELYDGDAYQYWFRPHDRGFGGAPNSPLEPGGLRVMYDQLQVPTSDRLDEPFWKPGRYELTAFLKLGRYVELRSQTRVLRITPRSKEESAAIKKFYDAGTLKRRAPVPDWDIYRPWLGAFGLATFPDRVSLPENLAQLHAKLGPGTLRNVVHLTRLAQAVYDAKGTTEKREATTELFAWLDSMPDVEREWLALKLVSWTLQNKGLGEFSFEFTDQVIPRLPDQCGDRNPQEDYRKENQYLRQSYLKYLQESTPGHRPAGD